MCVGGWGWGSWLGRLILTGEQILLGLACQLPAIRLLLCGHNSYSNQTSKIKIIKIKKKVHDNKVITGDKDISDAFNKYFCTIGKSLANKIPNVNMKYTDFMDESSTTSMFLLPATETEILKAISSLQ